MTEHEEETSTRPPPGKGKGGPGFGFQCKLTSSRVLVDGLSALHFGKKDQFASFTVNNVGLRVSVQNVAKTMHAVMYIKANVFDDFDPPVQEQSRHEEDDGEPEIRFSVNLGNLLECLRVFGSNVVDMTTVELKYHEMTGDLLVVLEESGSITECQLRTGIVDEELDFPSKFREYDTTAKVVFKSEPLRPYFNEIVDTIGSQLRLRVFKDTPYFQLTLAGELSSFALELPRTSDIFLTYDVATDTEQFYDTKTFSELLKPATMAEETYMRVNSNGMLAANHKIGSSSEKQCYVAFILLCADNDGDS
eukprot:gb/GECG01001162.1/.p1 GENE.gb/GECG01001162.1/~~gb/GECG01001162.1/.p1  ORF type:complete len:306 (+),score=45.15 gb/GECG01001162.1/:1-918(+)